MLKDCPLPPEGLTSFLMLAEQGKKSGQQQGRKELENINYLRLREIKDVKESYWKKRKSSSQIKTWLIFITWAVSDIAKEPISLDCSIEHLVDFYFCTLELKLLQ